MSDFLSGGLIGVLGKLSEAGGDKPFDSCPAVCTVRPEACNECGDCKRRLEAVLDRLENQDSYLSNYVVDPSAAPGGERVCYVCGAPADISGSECEYCGADLNDGRSPIRVRSMGDIPNPSLEAQDIIFERNSIINRYQKQKNESRGGLLGALMGAGANMVSQMSGFDSKMSRTEIEEMASSYGVSVHTYLKGLDAGTYFTKKGKANQDAMNQMNQQLAAQNAANAQARQQQSMAGGGTAATGARRGSYTMLDYQYKRASQEAAKYCCGNCSHYIKDAAQCVYFNASRTASEYCNNFSS